MFWEEGVFGFHHSHLHLSNNNTMNFELIIIIFKSLFLLFLFILALNNPSRNSHACVLVVQRLALINPPCYNEWLRLLKLIKHLLVASRYSLQVNKLEVLHVPEYLVERKFA